MLEKNQLLRPTCTSILNESFILEHIKFRKKQSMCFTDSYVENDKIIINDEM